MRACCFDLETTNLSAEFMGVILVGCVKKFDGKTVTFRRDEYPGWKDKRSDDSAIAKDIYNELKKYDIWIAHNGVCFDDKFLRSRLAHAGVRMPSHKFVDPVRLSRRYFRFRSNTLESVARHFGIYGKTHVEPKFWNQAALDGDRKAMDYIVQHCEADVAMLEKLADQISYLVPKVTQWGSDV